MEADEPYTGRKPGREKACVDPSFGAVIRDVQVTGSNPVTTTNNISQLAGNSIIV